MNYNNLKEILHNERNQGTLSKIPSTFYIETAKYIHSLELKEEINVSVYRNVLRVTEEITERRMNKISNSVFYEITKNNQMNKEPVMSIVEEQLPLNMVPVEKELYSTIYSCFHEFLYKIYQNYLDENTRVSLKK